jgi:hypothetical protein
MHCLLCHSQPIVSTNSRKQLKKGLITYYKTNGITCLQKHLDVNHLAIYKRFQEKINNQRKKNVEKQYANKRFLISNPSTSKFFASKDPFKKNDVRAKDVCGECCTFNSEKSFAFAICGECVVKAFNVTMISLCEIPFLKTIFKHFFA